MIDQIISWLRLMHYHNKNSQIHEQGNCSYLQRHHRHAKVRHAGAALRSSLCLEAQPWREA
jgi:hypothetical protein